MVDHEYGTTEDDRLLLVIADELQAEWQMGGLSRGLYFEFAAEIATRFAARKVTTEREACALLCDQWDATPGKRLATEIRMRSNDSGNKPPLRAND